MWSRVLSALALLSTFQACLAVTYHIRNNCPTPIELFVTGVSQGTLGTGATVSRSHLGNPEAPNAGTIYTSANEGIVGDQYSIVVAGFSWEYYYVLRQSDSNRFNTGVTITPNVAPNNGFCTTSSCLEGNCTTAFRYPPIWKDPLPGPDEPAPAPPTHRCSVPDIAFDVTFCPGGNWPPVRGATIFRPQDYNKCVDVKGAVLANGTPVQIYDCNDTNAQRWFFSLGGPTHFQLAGTNFCLDAGSNPSNGTPMKIWQCYDNLPAQQWHFTNERQIALEGTGLCLDIPSGNTTNGNVLQTWTCNNNNANQVWYIPDLL